MGCRNGCFSSGKCVVLLKMFSHVWQIQQQVQRLFDLFWDSTAASWEPKKWLLLWFNLLPSKGNAEPVGGVCSAWRTDLFCPIGMFKKCPTGLHYFSVSKLGQHTCPISMMVFYWGICVWVCVWILNRFTLAIFDLYSIRFWMFLTTNPSMIHIWKLNVIQIDILSTIDQHHFSTCTHIFVNQRYLSVLTSLHQHSNHVGMLF